MTMAMLSEVLMATSGLAPWFSATIRFWISVDSLNRPPTLLTIPSSFNSSSIRVPREQGLDDVPQLVERGLPIVVDDLEIVVAGAAELDLGRAQPPLNLLLGFGAALAEPAFVFGRRRGAHEDRHGVGAQLLDLG